MGDRSTATIPPQADAIGTAGGHGPATTEVRDLYLDLMKHTQTPYAFGETWEPYEVRRRSPHHLLLQAATTVLRRHGIHDPLRQVDWTGRCWRRSP